MTAGCFNTHRVKPRLTDGTNPTSDFCNNPSNSATRPACWVHSTRLEADMRAWFILGAAFFAMAAVLALWQSRDDDEMFIRLGNRDLRSLPV
jgi:hypothetical protein